MPFAVETCGYMGKEAMRFVNRLSDIAAESGRTPEGAFVCWPGTAGQSSCCRRRCSGGMLRCSAGVGWSSRDRKGLRYASSDALCSSAVQGVWNLLRVTLRRNEPACTDIDPMQPASQPTLCTFHRLRSDPRQLDVFGAPLEAQHIT